jgi:thermitase
VTGLIGQFEIIIAVQIIIRVAIMNEKQRISGKLSSFRKYRKIHLSLLVILTITLFPFNPAVIERTSSIQGLPGEIETDSFNARPERWDLLRIKADEAWRITTGRPDIIIAVLDTGIDEQHKALGGKIITSVNFTKSLTENDVNGHGTHIAGIIAGNKDSETCGLACNCSLLNVKVAEDDGFCDAETLAKGIKWAADNGALVINISLTIAQNSPSIDEAVEYAWNKGCVIVAAAGNNFNSQPVYPACDEHVIAVSAVDSEDTLPPWANYGRWVDILAPGVGIRSTAPGGGYIIRSGTSQAAAIVSAEVALLLSVATDTNSNGLINDEATNALLKGTDNIPVTYGSRAGRINVISALRYLKIGN